MRPSTLLPAPRVALTESYRLQLQGELQSKKEAVRLYKGVFHGVGVILKNEGPKGLLRGLGCAVCICAARSCAA